MFARIFFDRDYVTARFRIRSDLIRPFRELEMKLRNRRARDLTFCDWAKNLKEIWRLDPSDLTPVEPLILGILNYPIPGRPLSRIPSLRQATGSARARTPRRR